MFKGKNIIGIFLVSLVSSGCLDTLLAPQESKVLPGVDLTLTPQSSNLSLQDLNDGSIADVTRVDDYQLLVHNLRLTQQKLDKWFDYLNDQINFNEGVIQVVDGATTLKGKFTVNDNSASYKYELYLCKEDKPVIEFAWNSSAKLKLTTDFRHFALAGEDANALAINVISDTTQGVKTLQLKSYGRPWVLPSDTSEDNGLEFMAENILAIDDAQNKTISVVREWGNAIDFPVTKSGMDYLVAYANGSDFGYVSKRVHDTQNCRYLFSAADPSWCIGKDYENTTELLTAEKRSEYWTKMKERVGVMDERTLSSVEFTSNVQCN